AAPGFSPATPSIFQAAQAKVPRPETARRTRNDSRPSRPPPALPSSPKATLRTRRPPSPDHARPARGAAKDWPARNANISCSTNRVNYKKRIAREKIQAGAITPGEAGTKNLPVVTASLTPLPAPETQAGAEPNPSGRITAWRTSITGPAK